jgi:anti-sigma factor RsiW
MTTCTAWASAIDDVALGVAPSSAFATHLHTCAACAEQLERRRALAQRIDGALGAYVRAEPPARLAERIATLVWAKRSRHRRRAWLVGIPVVAALAAGLLIFVDALGGGRAVIHPTDVAALEAWRSPTASLLVSRNSVLGTFSVTTNLRSLQ